MITLFTENDEVALRKVHVRPILDGEKAEWDAIIANEHYLGNARMAGRTLRYVAELDGQWVALIGWGSSAYHLRARDEWIGWSDLQRRERLSLVVGNLRFLCRADRGEFPNLASRVLALNLARLESDWQEIYGYPPLLLETFVDLERYAGTCYKASNWIELGKTAGYRRSAVDYYEAHDKPKRLFTRELHPEAREWLCAETLPEIYTPALSNLEPQSPLVVKEWGSLFACFQSIPDPRASNRRYKIGTLLSIVASALMCGISSYEGLERFGRRLSPAQRNRLRCPKDKKTGAFECPCANTYGKLFDQMNLEIFDQKLGEWISSLDPERGKELALDGKTLKGTAGPEGRAIALLAVYAHRDGGVIHQLLIEGGDEIHTARKAIAALPALDGKLLTLDALHTQTETARQIVQDKGGDYLFTVKGNQPTLETNIEGLFAKKKI
jgi:hypothetical protein